MTDVSNDSSNIEIENYKSLFRETIIESYPKYIQKDILSKLEKNSTVWLKKNSAKKSQQPSIDLSDLGEEEQLIEGIEHPTILKFLEKREFTKSYNFSAIFNSINKNENIFEELEKSKKLLNFNSPDFVFDEVIDINNPREIIPTMFTLGNIKIFKFSKLLTGYVPQNGSKKIVRYNVLGVYYSYLNILEIRFDRVKALFQYGDDLFYHNQIEGVIKWFKNVAKLQIENINLSPIINYINKKDQDEVTVHSQAMSMSTGAKAELYTAENGAPILPLLGELKELIRINEELFDESPKIKDLLDKFITQTEDTSDLPWISLRWKGDEKNEGIHVKFKHNYENKGYTLLHFFGRQTNMEKMDNVTQYIIDNRDEIDRNESIESAKADEIIKDN